MTAIYARISGSTAPSFRVGNCRASERTGANQTDRKNDDDATGALNCLKFGPPETERRTESSCLP